MRYARLGNTGLQVSAVTLGCMSWGDASRGGHGWVKDEASAADWIGGVVTQVLPRLDLPVMAELHAAWLADDLEHVRFLSQFLHACRESAELSAEDRHLGAALARVLHGLGVARAEPWIADEDAAFATLFSLAAVHFEVPLRSAALIGVLDDNA